MSPTESDLRAALRDGEGDGPNVDRVIALGRARRTQTRHQLLAAAAVVVVVGGVGSAVLVGGNNSADKSANNGAADAFGAAGGNSDAAGGMAPLHSAAASGYRPAASAPASAVTVACPAATPTLQQKSGASTAQPLLSRAVSAFIVCSYGTPEQAAEKALTPARVVLTGERAAELSASLAGASTARTPRTCPNIATSTPRALALIPIAGDGRVLDTVTTTLVIPACNVLVTNGSAVRYQWSPPANLQGLFESLSPTVNGSALPVPNRPKRTPSPITS